jgi:hypothetical protein
VEGQARQGRGLSWPAVIGWICLIMFAASLWNGSDNGPLFWAGAVSIDVLVVGSVFVLVRWITRRVESRWG